VEKDYENASETDQLSDNELRALIVDTFDQQVAFDPNDVEIAVPGDLSIAGFDDGPTARVAWPPITTIRQPVGEMAAAAVDILIDPAYRDKPGDPRFHRELPYELIVRGSTAPLAI